MRDIKRFMCLLMATATVASCFTGCGENGSADAGMEVTDAGTTVVAAGVKGAIDNKPASINDNVGITKFEGNSIYYMSYDESFKNVTMCVFDMATGEEHKLNTIETASYDYTKPNTYIADFYADAQGNVVELINETSVNVNEFDFKPENITEDDAKKALVEEWGFAEDDMDSCLNKDGEFAQAYVDSEGNLRYDWIYVACVGYKYGSTATSRLVTYDMSGNAVNTVELGSTQINDNGNSSFVTCGKDQDGNALVLGYEWETATETERIVMNVFDAQGAKKSGSEFEGINSSAKIFNSADGASKLGYWDENGGYTIADFDAANGTTSTVTSIPDYSAGALKDANTLIYTNGSDLFSCDLATGEITTLANLAEYGIQEYALQSVGVMEDGTVVGFVLNYSEATQSCTADVVKF